MDRYHGESVRGVRVNCDGYRIKEFSSGPFDPDVPRFEDFRVPVTHPFFETALTLLIPKALGVPILTKPYPRRAHFEAHRVPRYDGQPGINVTSTTYSSAYLNLTQDWLLALRSTASYRE